MIKWQEQAQNTFIMSYDTKGSRKRGLQLVGDMELANHLNMKEDKYMGTNTNTNTNTYIIVRI